MTEVTVVLSDIQYPYHDKRAVKTVLNFIRSFRPHGLLCVGDELDAPQPSRWNKSMAGEYAGDLQRDIDGCAALMAEFRTALGPQGRFRVQRSNHTDRIQTYLNRYAPALAGLRALDYETLLGYRDNGIEFIAEPTEVLPGWLMLHGDEGSLSRIPGSTAMGLARKSGMSVVCGHTHRLGVQHETVGFSGKTKTIYGFEVGNLMDMRQAHYLQMGVANWQQGIGLLYLDGRNVTPVAVPIHRDGSMSVEGKVYR